MQVIAGKDIATLLRQEAADVDRELAARFDRLTDASPRLVQAMRYSLEAGGKRLRPALVLWCCDLCGGRRMAALPAALAVECVHTFSLIHDDLPALDNDDLRRGRPSCHKKFGEALAILAGDALLNLAYETIANETDDASTCARLVRELATAAGCLGMIGGEAKDLEGEKLPPSSELVDAIHAAKTARLISACCRMGAVSARADERRISVLGDYGRELGLAFQAADDMLDVTGRGELLGKATGKDSAAGKQTYLRAVGMEEGRRRAEEAAERAASAIRPFGSEAWRLERLARFVVEREA